MRTANWIFGLLFLSAALVQWNDPDPWRWFLIYLAAGAVSIAASYRTVIWKLAAIIAVLGALWAAALVPEVAQSFRVWSLFSTMKAENPEIEMSRELLGLLIILGWMIVVMIDCRSRRSGHEPSVDRRQK